VHCLLPRFLSRRALGGPPRATASDLPWGLVLPAAGPAWAGVPRTLQRARSELAPRGGGSGGEQHHGGLALLELLPGQHRWASTRAQPVPQGHVLLWASCPLPLSRVAALSSAGACGSLASALPAPVSRSSATGWRSPESPCLGGDLGTFPGGSR